MLLTRCVATFVPPWLATLILLFTSIMDVHADSHIHSYVPPAGFVPDSRTAVAIAEAVLIPIYGQDGIQKQKPLLPRLKGGKWTVIGQLKKGWLGGVALVVIDKKTGRILRVSHGR